MNLQYSIRIATVSVLLCSVAFSQSTLNVPSSSFSTIQSAIVAANSGDTILVGPGTYIENIDYQNKTLSIVGSGPGISTIDGNQMGSTVTSNGLNCVLDGFTITNGSGTPITTLSGTILMGGGVLVHDGAQAAMVTTTIRNCEITANSADWGAGLQRFQGASLTLEDCIFSSNTMGISVGAYIAAQVTIRRCRFVGNSAGCIALDNNTPSASLPNQVPLIEDCYFGQNIAAVSSIALGATPTQGAGIWVTSAHYVLRRCVFDGNVADEGAALYFGGLGDRIIENCLFINNTALDRGGVVKGGGNPAVIPVEFRNCTFVANSATNDGNVLSFPGGDMDFINCIFQTNTGAPSLIAFQPTNAATGTISMFNCNVQGGWANGGVGGWTQAGSGNFDSPPLFEDSMNGDYRIRPDSPCVDAGTTSQPHPLEDFEGDTRPLFGVLLHESSRIGPIPSEQRFSS